MLLRGATGRAVARRQPGPSLLRSSPSPLTRSCGTLPGCGPAHWGQKRSCRRPAAPTPRKNRSVRLHVPCPPSGQNPMPARNTATIRQPTAKLVIRPSRVRPSNGTPLRRANPPAASDACSQAGQRRLKAEGAGAALPLTGPLSPTNRTPCCLLLPSRPPRLLGCLLLLLPPPRRLAVDPLLNSGRIGRRLVRLAGWCNRPRLHPPAGAAARIPFRCRGLAASLLQLLQQRPPPASAPSTASSAGAACCCCCSGAAAPVGAAVGAACMIMIGGGGGGRAGGMGGRRRRQGGGERRVVHHAATAAHTCTQADFVPAPAVLHCSIHPLVVAAHRTAPQCS